MIYDSNMTKSIIDKLLELKQLYEKGILTKEEIEVEKKKILGNGNSNVSEESHGNDCSQMSSENALRNDSFFQKNKKLIFYGLGLIIFAIIGFVFSNMSKKAPSTIEETINALEADVSDVESFACNKDTFNNKLNSASWIKHYTGFSYPDFFKNTTCFVDDVPGEVEIYSWEDVKMCYWPFLGNWSTLDDFPYEGIYISPTDKVKNVVYTARNKDIFSGYTENNDIYYLKRKIIPDEVSHGRFLVLIHPSSYKGDATNRLTRIVANW